MNRLVIVSAFCCHALLLASFVLPAGCEPIPGEMNSISVAPDGKFIAVDFSHGSASFIYKISIDTGAATRLTNAKAGYETHPSFSPDGRRIAYSYSPSKGARFRIVIANVDGTDAHAWSPPDADDFSPVFSPDNKTIIFGRSRYYGSYCPIAQPHSHAWDFYAANLDGTNLRQLTNESFYMASAISVSPDGRSMAVVTEGLETNRQISVYSLDQPGQLKVALRPHVPKEADHKNPILNAPNFMPDGRSILFMAASDGKHGYDYDVYRIDLQTQSLERFTNGNSYATALRVFPDGKTAVFLKWRSDWHATPVESFLYLLDLTTHTLTPLKVSGLN